jgi:hypothetical protein
VIEISLKAQPCALVVPLSGVLMGLVPRVQDHTDAILSNVPMLEGILELADRQEALEKDDELFWPAADSFVTAILLGLTDETRPEIQNVLASHPKNDLFCKKLPQLCALLN